MLLEKEVNEETLGISEWGNRSVDKMLWNVMWLQANQSDEYLLRRHVVIWKCDRNKPGFPVLFKAP